MIITEQLKSLLPNTYFSEDLEEYQIELLSGLTDSEIDDLAKGFPTGQIPGSSPGSHPPQQQSNNGFLC